MFCPSCGVTTQEGQRFCNVCGVAIAAPPPTPGTPFPPPALPQPDAATIAVPVGQIPAIDSPEFDEFFHTADFSVVEQTTPTREQLAGVNDTLPQLTEQYQRVVASPPAPLRWVLLVLAVATAAVTATAAFLTNVSFRVSGDIQYALQLKLNDIATNALVAALLSALLLVVGAAVALSGRRLGAGLAGGAGLAVAAFMGWMASVAVSIIDTVKQGMAAKGVTYTLSTTLDVGFWLCVAAAGLGAAVFLLSFTSAGADGHARLHQLVAVLGLAGAIAAAVGPLLPMGQAAWADNLATDHAVGAPLWWKAFLQTALGVDHPAVPPVATWMRLGVLVMLLMGVAVGFVAGSRWGIGMAIGAVAVSVWQWLTSLLKAGEWPFGIAGGNPGQIGFRPHIVTTIGVATVLVAALLGALLVASADYRSRRRVSAATR